MEENFSNENGLSDNILFKRDEEVKINFNQNQKSKMILYMLKLEIKQKFNSFFSNFQRKIKLLKISSFYLLKNSNFSKSKIKSNEKEFLSKSSIQKNILTLKNIFYYNAKNKLLKLLKIYNSKNIIENYKSKICIINNNKNTQLLNYFSTWKILAFLERKSEEIQKQTEGNFFRKIENYSINLHSKQKSIEKEVSYISSKLSDFKNNFSKQENLIQQHKEKENEMKNKLNSSMEERKSLQEQKSIKKKELAEIESHKNVLEISCKDQERLLQDLNTQSKERDSNLCIYIKEMNEMLEVFEKNSSKDFFNIIGDLIELPTNFNDELFSSKDSYEAYDALKGEKLSISQTFKNGFKITSLPSNLVLKKNSKTNTLSKTNSKSLIKNSILTKLS